jgi:hypothetical protein
MKLLRLTFSPSSQLSILRKALNLLSFHTCRCAHVNEAKPSRIIGQEPKTLEQDSPDWKISTMLAVYSVKSGTIDHL